MISIADAAAAVNSVVSAPIASDAFGWKDVALYVIAPLFAVLCGLIAFIVNSGMKRVDDHIKEDRENFIMVFTGQKTISENISTGFRGMESTISGIHVKLLERINDVQQSNNGKER